VGTVAQIRFDIHVHDVSLPSLPAASRCLAQTINSFLVNNKDFGATPSDLRGNAGKIWGNPVEISALRLWKIRRNPSTFLAKFFRFGCDRRF
jgi:hypothetical protein